jgi:alanine racemase
MRSRARVDLDAIAHNVGVLRERAGRAEVMAVVKADGYGHGLVPSARAAVRGGATWLGVAFLEEALALRAAGVTTPVLAWLFGPDEDLAAAIRADVELGIYTVDELRLAQQAAQSSGVQVKVQLKADTGLLRGGATPQEWPELCEAAAKAEADGTVAVTALWSHFAFADGGPDHPVNNRQAALFEQALEIAAAKGLDGRLRHLANSAATLTAPETHYDVVRPGLAVYGLSPVPQLGAPKDFGLRPAMSLHSTVVQTKRVPEGSGVSYLHRYTTSCETTLALVPLGYGDGIPRAATNAAEVLLNGSRRRIAGTVSMDQFVLDVGDDGVQVGNEVLLLGDGSQGEPTAQDWADSTGTIDYEIVTRIGSRVPRDYVGEQ